MKGKKLALFICAGEQDPAIIERELASAFPEELHHHAIIREVFGGELHWGKLDLMTKLILRYVKGIRQGYSRLSEVKIDRLARVVADTTQVRWDG